MITLEDEIDLRDEIYKLIGVKNLLNIWSGEEGGYEIIFISNALNEIVADISRILKINPGE